MVGKWTPKVLVIIGISSGALESGAKTEFEAQKMFWREYVLKIKRKG